MLDISEMHWVTGVQYARQQTDISYQEWCDLYYDHLDPTPEQIKKACETALPILHRNAVISPDVTELFGTGDGPDAWPRRDDPNPTMSRYDTAGAFIKTHNLAANKQSQFKIEGPWAWRGLEGHETVLYIFEPGAKRVEIGKVTARIEKGLVFDFALDPDYRNVESAGFEVPMRYNLIQKKRG